MDNSATSPIKEEVLNEMLPYLKEEDVMLKKDWIKQEQT